MRWSTCTYVIRFDSYVHLQWSIGQHKNLKQHQKYIFYYMYSWQALLEDDWHHANMQFNYIIVATCTMDLAIPMGET